jgi:small subunit ribosomal protein S1
MPDHTKSPYPSSTDEAADPRAEAERAEFEAALAAGGHSRPKFEIGQLVKGVVASVQNDAILVSFGGKSEFVLPRAEGETEVKEGDPIEAVVVSVSPELRLSRGLAAERRNAEELRQAYEARVPVEGKVLSRNKGGYNVTIGKVSAFCPGSQIDLGRGRDPNSHVNETYTFRIIEYGEGGRKIVVSRAALLREEREAKELEIRAKLAVGSIFEGPVTSITDYGAFVDIGGIEGMVHVSELSRRRVGHPKEIVTPGQVVKVKVTKIDETGRRISLSMKEFEKDPWADALDRYGSGSSFTGKILRVADFGFFVEIEPGFEGLLHVSQLPPGMAKNDPALAPGEMVRGWIRDIDPVKRKIGLALREVATGDPWADIDMKYPLESVFEGQLERIAPFGLFVLLEPGLTGLVPNSETGTPPGTDLARQYAPGQKVIVKLIAIDKQKKKLTLSIEGARLEAARGEFREYSEKAAADAGSTGMTALAAAFARAQGREPEKK